LRTLITTAGKQPAQTTDDVVRCFEESHQLGFWLDIEAPDDNDYRLLEETFK